MLQCLCKGFKSRQRKIRVLRALNTECLLKKIKLEHYKTFSLYNPSFGEATMGRKSRENFECLNAQRDSPLRRWHHSASTRHTFKVKSRPIKLLHLVTSSKWSAGFGFIWQTAALISPSDSYVIVLVALSGRYMDKPPSHAVGPLLLRTLWIPYSWLSWTEWRLQGSMVRIENGSMAITSGVSIKITYVHRR